jgi:hypothetical protein
MHFEPFVPDLSMTMRCEENLHCDSLNKLDRTSKHIILIRQSNRHSDKPLRYVETDF